MKKIEYSTGSSSAFFKALNKEVQEQIINTGLLQKARRELWMKMLFYFLLHICSYVVLYNQTEPACRHRFSLQVP
jgi:hypothetical protein